MNPADDLRTAQSALLADPRSDWWIKQPCEEMQSALDDRVGLLEQYRLHEGVPENIHIHFATAKNLYLYAFFVYRFHMAAEHYVYSTLELALRIRFNPPDGEIGAGWKPGLARMLKRALEEGLLEPKEFALIRHRAKMNAEHRQSREIMETMREQGLRSYSFDKAAAIPTEQDYAVDWFEDWIEGLADVRNIHAHGTSSVWPDVLGSFERISEVINQIFSKHDR